MNRGDDEAWTDPSDAEIEAAADRIRSFDGEVEREAVRSIDGSVERIAWISRPAQLPDARLCFLLEHWQSIASAQGGVPGRHTIDVLDLAPAIGNLMMLEVERDGFDAVYRVYGTAVAARAARDWTGFRVSEMNRTTRTPLALLYRACYRAVFSRPAPLYTEHHSPPYLDVRSWQRLILPLADGDRPCSRFLVCNVPIGHRSLSEEDLEELERRLQRPLLQAYPSTV